MKIAIIGASGFIGSALTRQLLDTSSHQLVLFSHHARRLTFTPNEEKSITEIDGNVLVSNQIQSALTGCNLAIYLVHLIGSTKNGKFINAERQAAENFAAAAKHNQLSRVIYIGGMGQPVDAHKSLTKHLQSRQQTGTIIKSQVRQLIEFRTPMVIGNGGAGYDVLRWWTDKLPALIIPRWARAVTQPISVADVVSYITAAIETDHRQHISVDIGGPEQLSYIQVARRYADQQHRRLTVIALPGIPKRLAAAVLRLNRHNPAWQTVADMIDSASYRAVITDKKAQQLFPNVVPQPILMVNGNH